MALPAGPAKGKNSLTNPPRPKIMKSDREIRILVARGIALFLRRKAENIGRGCQLYFHTAKEGT
jgi:hypothetical protein